MKHLIDMTYASFSEVVFDLCQIFSLETVSKSSICQILNRLSRPTEKTLTFFYRKNDRHTNKKQKKSNKQSKTNQLN